MKIGICGVSNIGKSKLALELCTTLNLTYVSSVLKTLVKEDVMPHEDFGTFVKRMDFQAKVLRDMCEKLETVSDDFLMDVTPIDAVSYLMADLSTQSIKEVNECERGEEECDITCLTNIYIRKAVQVCNEFDYVILLQPNPLVHARSPIEKKKAHMTYMEHINLLNIGSLAQLSTEVICVPRELTGTIERAQFIRKAIEEKSAKRNEKRQAVAEQSRMHLSIN